MEHILSLAGILGALLVGAITPGPSFILVVRTSMAASRVDGLFTALGMGIGAMIFSILVLLGLQVALAAVPKLYLMLKVAGGLYLLYMAAHIWRNALKPVVMSNNPENMRISAKRFFLLGLFTQLSNPKTAIVYGGIFAALLPQRMPAAAYIALPFLVFLIEAGWYAVVAFALSSEPSRTAYLRSKMHIDRMTGMAIGLLGLRLISSKG